MNDPTLSTSWHHGKRLGGTGSMKLYLSIRPRGFLAWCIGPQNDPTMAFCVFFFEFLGNPLLRDYAYPSIQDLGFHGFQLLDLFGSLGKLFWLEPCAKILGSKGKKLQPVHHWNFSIRFRLSHCSLVKRLPVHSWV